MAQLIVKLEFVEELTELDGASKRQNFSRNLCRVRHKLKLSNKHMNIDELKKLVKHSMAVLVLDNGEPSFAILGYDMYKDLVLGSKEKEIKISHPSANGIAHNEDRVAPVKPALPENELEILERINKDILALKNEIEKEEKILTVDPFDKNAHGQY